MARFAASPGFQNALAAVSATGIDFNELGSMGQKAQSLQQQTAFDSKAKLKSTENQARALVEAAKEGAAGIVAQGQAAGNSAMMSGIMGGVSTLAGGLGGGGGVGGGVGSLAGAYGGGLDIGVGMSPSQVLSSPSIQSGFAPSMAFG